MWFVLYGFAAVPGLTILAVRAQVVTAGNAEVVAPSEGPASAGVHHPSTPIKVMVSAAARLTGVALFVVVLVARWPAIPPAGYNPAPLVVFVAFFMGMAAVSLLVGRAAVLACWWVRSPLTTPPAPIGGCRR